MSQDTYCPTENQTQRRAQPEACPPAATIAALSSPIASLSPAHQFELAFDDKPEPGPPRAGLESSEDRYTDLYDNAPIGCFVVAHEGTILESNRYGAQLLGCRGLGLRGVNLAQFVSASSMPAFHALLANAAGDSQMKMAEIELLPALADAPIWAHVNAQASSTRSLRLVIVDITERKRMEKALLESESRLKRAQEMAHVGSWEMDLVRDELTWSDEAYRIFGLRPQETVASYEGFLAFVHPEDRTEVGEAYVNSLREGLDTYELEHRIIRKSTGETRHVHVKCEHVRNAEGRVVRSIGTVDDITERKETEVQLRAAKAEAERANEAKSRFLAAASHDLRQPLAALNMYVGVLGYKLSPDDGPLLKNVKDCVASLSEMLNDLLDLSKLEAGVVTPEICDFPILNLLANVVAVHAPEAQAKGLALRCAPSDLSACTDPVLFGRVIGNLVANAIRYTEKGGVLIGCRRRRGKTWVEVWDTGIGIPADKTTEIFEEFRQLGNDARDRSKGSGLGLAIVAKAAALLGLQIRVRSQPGRGSMFAVEMPLGRAQRTEAVRDFTHRPLRIALVEDDLLVVEALVYALSEVGHQVLAAATAPDLLARLGNQAPDIVISDYRLADGETGFDVVTAVRTAFGEDVPALLITGDTDPQLIRGMTSQGIRVQHKPVELDALQLCIADLTGEATGSAS